MQQRVPALSTVLVLFGIALSLSARAEVPSGFALGARVGIVTLGGDYPFGDVDPAFELDGSVRYATSKGFAIGAGFTYVPEFEASIGTGLSRFGVYLEPRFAVALRDSSFAPFIGGRVGYESFGIRTGVFVGGTAGLTVLVAPQVGVEVAATLNFIRDTGGFETFNSIGLTAGVVLLSDGASSD